MEHPIEFSVREQNCLAEVCCIMSSVSHSYHNGYAITTKTIEQLEEVVDRFEVNWGELYDKFHRQGKNR